MTEYNPIFRSPITVPTPTAGTPSDLALSDYTGVQVTLVQGEVGDILKKQVSTVPANPGAVADVGEGLLACLTPKEFYLFGKASGAKLPTATELDESFIKAKRFAHATDFTHRTALLKLSGSAASEALSKMCGLDFHDSVFPNMQVKQSSAAKIKTLITRCDENGTLVYHLHVTRPFGQYFWDIVWDAGQEFGITAGQ